jgi:hypothetical protein
MRHSKARAKPKAELPPLSPDIAARDHDAFERAIAMMRQYGPAKAAQIDGKLAHEGFTSAGKFASYCMQCETLRLKPWEAPPMDARGDVIDPNVYGCRPGEIALRNRLKAAGLSLFEPDPLSALEKLGVAWAP